MTGKMRKVKMALGRGNVRQARRDSQKRLTVDVPEANESELEKAHPLLTTSLKIRANNSRIVFKISLAAMSGCSTLWDQSSKSLPSKGLARRKTFGSFSTQRPFQQTNIPNPR